MTHITTYQQITKALTVTDIAQPIVGKFDKSTTIAELISELGDDVHLPGIVVLTESERPFAFITLPVYFENEDQSCSIDTKATPIDLRTVISSNVSLYELLPLWRHSRHYFILDGAEITHFVNEYHMNSAPVKTALFAMTAEFEDLILQLLMKDLTKIKERFERLPDDPKKAKKFKDMQKRAKCLAKKKGLPESSVAYIQSTYLSDKVDILLLDTEFCEFAFPDSDRSILENNLTLVSKFRNEMAHGGSLSNVVTGMKQLNEIVDLLEATIIDLRGKLNELPVAATPE